MAKKENRGRPRKVETEAMKMASFKIPVRVLRLIDKAHWELQTTKAGVVQKALEAFFRAKGIREV